jgi:hypothetical protein
MAGEATRPNRKCVNLDVALRANYAVALQGAVFLGPLAILLAPVGAIVGATLEGACGKKFTDAYPSLVTNFEGEARRELLSGDISDSVIGELQKHTSVPIVALRAVPSASEIDHAQTLLSDAAQRDLAYALVVTPTVALIPDTNDCLNGDIRVWLSVALWDVRTKGKIPLRPSSGYWDRLDVVVPFGELQTLLEEQGALRSRFLRFYASWASGLHTNAGFVLPAP